MTIKWRPELLVDDGRIDDEHKRLIEIINCFGAKRSHSKSRLTLIILSDYSRNHFLEEENVMLEIGSPGYHEHLVEHNWLIYTLLSIICTFNSSSPTCDVGMLRARASSLLKHWLVNRIINWDVPIAEFIGNYRRSCPDIPTIHNTQVACKTLHSNK